MKSGIYTKNITVNKLKAPGMCHASSIQSLKKILSYEI